MFALSNYVFHDKPSEQVGIITVLDETSGIRITYADIDANVSRLYFDIAGVQSAEVIKSMLSFAHPSKILYGSDFPYFREDVLLDTLNNLKKQMAEDRDLKPYVEAIFSENARQLFSH